MERVLTVSNLYDKNYSLIPFTGIWERMLGKQEYGGIWLIYGAEKNGKTSFALILANYLSTLDSVLYISAEEGLKYTFRQACIRAGIDRSNQAFKILPYVDLDSIRLHLRKRRAPRFVFIDNLSVYKDEMSDKVLLELKKEYPDTTFIYIAHEEDGEPYTATAKACRRFSDIIVRVTGLTAQVSGRTEGGTYRIDEEKAALLFGDSINR